MSRVQAYSLPIVLGGFRQVSRVNRFSHEFVLLEKLGERLVAAEAHALHLAVAPRVHPDRADEAHVHAEAAVHATAVEAHENAHVHRRPLRSALACAHGERQQKRGAAAYRSRSTGGFARSA